LDIQGFIVGEEARAFCSKFVSKEKPISIKVNLPPQTPIPHKDCAFDKSAGDYASKF